MTKEALTLALEAYIKAGAGNSTNFVLQSEAYDLAVEALEQPEQEPVAWYIREKDSVTTDGCWAEKNLDICEPLYTTPPQRTWVGLTTDDWDEIKKQVKFNFEMTTGEYAERVSHLVEDKLREKNK